MKGDYNVIGVMSGTSLDGIDLVYTTFYLDAKSKWSFNIVYSETVAYKKYWRLKLSNLVGCSADQLESIDEEYTLYLSHVIKKFILKNDIKTLDAVCSHGHTALHQPDKKLTYQIGNKSKLAALLNQTVVCDFRVQDVELGGQGAPLVPIGDKLLFSEYDFCINLGGFANISFDKKDERIAYDICPVNIVLNHYVRKFGFEYDDKGKLASKGKINQRLLNQLNVLDFYTDTPPKSLGLEWVNNNIFPIIDSLKLGTTTILRTFVEHVAMQIASEINVKPKASVLLTGGGVYNDFLVKRIKELTDSGIVVPSANIIEFKEALIFGFLGVLKLRNEVNCLKSVTGALNNHSSGTIFYP
jgi:anhydro-N-acetylmuramic acid kinase